MLNKYDLVLFDLDGTVADSDEMIVQSMYVLYDKYRNGVRTPREKIYYFSGPPIRETLKKEFPDMDNDFMFNEFVRVSWDLYDKYVVPFPHTIEMMEYLINRDVKVGIVTGKARESTKHCLDVLGLTTIVQYVVTPDDVTNLKPHPEGIFKSMEHFSIKEKKKVLYIGDNKSDYLTAKNAGVDIALVKWGPRKIDEDVKPDYWINDFLEMEDIING